MLGNVTGGERLDVYMIGLGDDVKTGVEERGTQLPLPLGDEIDREAEPVLGEGMPADGCIRGLVPKPRRRKRIPVRPTHRPDDPFD